MTDAALCFEDVALKFGEHEILKGVSLEVPEGAVVALAGRNGAGKTTLLRVASRVLRPSAGRVSIRGTPIDEFSRRDLAKELAVVPQDTPVSFPFRVIEVVLMGRSPHLGVLGFESRADVALARDVMARVGIEEFADRSILDLSGGERQLVLIARALTQEPRVLLLDEPTAHLDLAHRVAVLDLVRDFARDGRSALVISHDLALSARASDRLALLAEGRVLDCGRPADVLTPVNLMAAFGIRADVIQAPDGSPLVIPRSAASDAMS
ncbi:MAG: ABC transporter ATP-binding protein [Deltaproteobacteria bacterium]|nr:ABC transporter ATP-binding protein [Deltaproteobacteria bacterium]MBW2577302.1 ABC transporter ATP-binding protein [Deltaproteobacteria bacterium]MBW2692482.1 ABC transporter ATP-binding protein [Deltaproteobacteria bacterium]